MTTSTLTVPARFNGPPQSANGGWFAGAAAALAGDDWPAVTVRLASPPPLETPMSVEPGESRDGVAVRTAEGVLIATALPAAPLAPPAFGPIPYREAEALRAAYEGALDHPFATCFSCGTERDDGLRLAAAEVPGGGGSFAAAWEARELSREILWAALDCPGGWSAGIAGRPMVLGTMTAQIRQLPEPGETCVIMAWPRGGSGRRFDSGSAAYGQDGRLLGAAEAVWIAVDPAQVRPR